MLISEFCAHRKGSSIMSRCDLEVLEHDPQSILQGSTGSLIPASPFIRNSSNDYADSED